MPQFYTEYVGHIRAIIAEKARMEFGCLWAERQRDPSTHYCTITERLSTKINGLCDMIAAEVVDDADHGLICIVLSRVGPRLERVGIKPL